MTNINNACSIAKKGALLYYLLLLKISFKKLMLQENKIILHLILL